MNPFQMHVTCSVCDGGGMAHVGRGHPWLNDFSHSDPRVCRDNLKAAARKKKQEDEADQKRLEDFFRR